jgi:nifR3 family TIM-barrel protein
MNLYKPVKIGSIELQGNLFLAPVAGYTDRAYRSLCSEQGADLSFTELISAEALYRNPRHYGLETESSSKAARINKAAANLVRRGENEKCYAIQLFGGNSEAIYKAASLLAPLKPDVLDINAGCPVPKVVKSGAGSALMKDPSNLGRVVEAAVRASRESLGEIPVTLNIRSGWDESSLNYAECGRIAVEAGAAMVSLHPRTRCQFYGQRSKWIHISDLVSRLSVPVAGSGDLYTPIDAQQMFLVTGCAAVMFARGAQGNPFIFSETRLFFETGIWEQASYTDRITAAICHLEKLAADIGERSACLEMRKQFCAYTKGMIGGATLRRKIVSAETIEDYKKIVSSEADPSDEINMIMQLLGQTLDKIKL